MNCYKNNLNTKSSAINYQEKYEELYSICKMLLLKLKDVGMIADKIKLESNERHV